MKVLFLCFVLSTIACAFEVPFRCASMPTLRARELEERLDQITQRVGFGDDEILTSNDPQYSLQVMQIAIDTPSPSSPLGIELTEIDGRDLVVVSGVAGSSARTDLQVGDIISAVVLGEYVRFRTSGYDSTISAIQKARQGPTAEVILEINRLVESPVIQ